jgi:hypothetical protein
VFEVDVRGLRVGIIHPPILAMENVSFDNRFSFCLYGPRRIALEQELVAVPSSTYTRGRSERVIHI